jgi:hypothetical protein
MGHGMRLTAGMTVMSAAGVEYYFKPDHRDLTAVKSQWTVPEEDELQIFEEGYRNDGSIVFWQLRLHGGAVAVVGSSAAQFGPARHLHLAMFRGANLPWHGYPADTQRNNQDVPPPHVVALWVNSNLLSKRQAVRLRGRRPWTR